MDTSNEAWRPRPPGSVALVFDYLRLLLASPGHVQGRLAAAAVLARWRWFAMICDCDWPLQGKSKHAWRPRPPASLALVVDHRRPDNWLSDVEVDKGNWVYWLPEGWTQGIRTQVESRKQKRCHFTSQGELSPDAHTDVRAFFFAPRR